MLVPDFNVPLISPLFAALTVSAASIIASAAPESPKSSVIFPTPGALSRVSPTTPVSLFPASVLASAFAASPPSTPPKYVAAPTARAFVNFLFPVSTTLPFSSTFCPGPTS